MFTTHKTTGYYPLSGFILYGGVMLKVTYRLKLGQDEFELNLDVKDEKEFFEQISFYSNLPKTAPGGSTDLKIVFRTNKQGHKYYSLVSEKEKKEFKFGQNTDSNGGGLFQKGWGDLYEGEDAKQPDSGVSAPMPGAVSQNVQKAPQQVSAPVMPAMPGMLVPPQVATQAPPTVPQPTQPSPQVQATAANVLARFGLNK